MRLLIVHDLLAGTGGAEQYIREITTALSDLGSELAFLTAPDQHPAWARGSVYSLERSEGWRSGRRLLPILRRVVEAVNPDLIYFHTMIEFLSPFLFKVLVERAPSVLFVHDVRLICPNRTKILRATGAPCTKPMGLACLKGSCCRVAAESVPMSWWASAVVAWRLAICREVGRLIAPSRYVAGELTRNGIPPERVVVLPHFTERRPGPRVTRPDIDLLWVGRFGFDRTKGFETFADGIARLRDLPWRAIVAGDGPALPEAKTLVHRLGLAPRITFLGRLNDAELDACYARARVTVVTSQVAESFCMVGIEAMAHGCPVVAFDVGGIREWLRDGTTGFAVPPGDIDTLAAAIRRLLTEPGLAERFGKAGRICVDDRFRRAAHLAGLLETLEAARDEWHEANHTRGLDQFRQAMSRIA